MTIDELRSAGRSRVVTTCEHHLVREYLREHQNITEKVEGRLGYID